MELHTCTGIAVGLPRHLPTGLVQCNKSPGKACERATVGMTARHDIQIIVGLPRCRAVGPHRIASRELRAPFGAQLMPQMPKLSTLFQTPTI